MRKIALVAMAMVCLGTALQAQITKGSLFLGGSVGFNSGKNEATMTQPGNPVQKSKSSSWSIRPQIGTAVAANQVAGLFLNFGKSRNEQTSGNSVTLNESTTSGGGIFYRRYYPFSPRFYIFGDAALGVNFGKTQTTNDNGTFRYVSSKADLTGVGLSLTPGLSFAASRKLFLEATLNDLLSFAYNSSENKFYDFRGNLMQTNKGNEVLASANANGFSGLSVGLRWILPRKK